MFSVYIELDLVFEPGLEALEFEKICQNWNWSENWKNWAQTWQPENLKITLKPRKFSKSSLKVL